MLDNYALNFEAAPETLGRMMVDSNDALEAAHAFPNAAIVSVHKAGWFHFKENASELAHSFETLGMITRLTSLERGVPVTFPLAPA